MVNPSWDAFQSPPNRQPPPAASAAQQQSASPFSQNNQDEEEKEDKKADWGSFQDPMTYQGPVDPTADEGMFDYLMRGKVRLDSRIAEQVLGAVGNVEKFSRDILSKVPAAGGLLPWAISEYLGPERWQNLIKGEKSDKQTFPTSSDFKEVSKKVSKGYTEAKTKGEGELDELVEDVASTFLTRRIPGGRLQQMANHFLIPAAANGAKKIVNDLGFGEDKANLAKMSVWFPLSLANNINGSRYASDLMNRGRNGFNQNQVVNVPGYQNQLNGVARNMLHGDPRSALAQQQIAGITDDLANGRTTMRDLMTRYDAINAAKRDRGLFQLNARDRGAAIRNINQVRDVVRDQITTLGQSNPQALMDWQNGVQAWATIHRSNSISNYVQDLAKGPYAKILSGPAAALFGAGGYASFSHPLISGSTTGIAAGGYKTGQVLYRMWNDPNLQTYYWNAINGAMENNLPVFLSNYEKLNKKLKESAPMEPEGKRKK